MWYRPDIDIERLTSRLTNLERRHIPISIVRGLNDAAFDVRENWMREIPSIFDRPTPLTTRAVLVQKATLAEPIADVYIRNEAGKGTPPSKYLIAEAQGGARRAKGVEAKLRGMGILAADEFIVPARGVSLDQYGNVPGSLIQQMLADLTAHRAIPNASGDRGAGRAASKLRKRLRNRRQRQEFGSFFESAPEFSKSQGKHQPLPRGIYQRRGAKFRGPSRGSIRMVFAIVKQPRYSKRFDPIALTRAIFDRQFPKRFYSALNARLGQGR